MDEPHADATDAGGGRSNVTLASRHLNPETSVALGPRVNETPYAVCALVALVVFLATLMLLLMDYTALKGI